MKLRKWNSIRTLPADWEDRLVVLWEEDDARPPGGETVAQAMKRIFNRDIKFLGNPVAKADWDDAGGNLYYDGIFVGWSCQGDFISILVVEV